MSDSLRPHGLYSPWNSPGQNTEWVALPFSRGSSQPRDPNPGLLHCRQILYQLSHKGSPRTDSSVAELCLTICDPMDWSTPGFPVHQQLPELAQTHILWVGDAIQPFHPLLSPSPPAFNLSQYQGLFRWVSSSNQVAKVLEFQLQHQSFQWISGLISFRMDWLDLLAVQGTLKSLFQHHSSKASIFQCSASL